MIQKVLIALIIATASFNSWAQDRIDNQPAQLSYKSKEIKSALYWHKNSKTGKWENRSNTKLVYLGDGNNVCNSLLYACAIMGIDMVACCPAVRMPNAEIMWKASKIAEANGSQIIASHDPQEACVVADVLYTDTWISMGDKTSEEDAIKLFQAYQINDQLLSIAKPTCIVMHCLPAHRGQEITNEVIEGPHSVVFDQAENRLHAQKAVLYTLMKD